MLFFFIDPAATEIYTLSLHDALPISSVLRTLGWTTSARRPPACRPSSRPWWARSRPRDRKSTRLNSSHTVISYAVFCLKKKNKKRKIEKPHRECIEKAYITLQHTSLM